MARVSDVTNFTNPVKSITFIPDHYVNISVTAPESGVTEYKAGQVVKIDPAKLQITTLGENDGNAIVFTDTKVNEGEGTPVTVLIHGFVNGAKLIDGEKLDPACKQITVLGEK